MSEFEEMALDLCQKYGLTYSYAVMAATAIATEDKPEREILDELYDTYGEEIFD